jgi:hypothetical protein
VQLLIVTLESDMGVILETECTAGRFSLQGVVLHPITSQGHHQEVQDLAKETKE